MKIISRISLLAIFVFAGCVTTPGDIRTYISEFDGAKEIVMEPAWVCKEGTFGTCLIKFGLMKRSTMPQDEVILVAMVKDIQSFKTGESLHFNIDGDIVSFASIDTTTEFEITEGIYLPGVTTPTGYSGVYFPPEGWSSKRYLIDKNFLEKILKAERVAVRIDLRKGYVEGIFFRRCTNISTSCI